MIRPIAFDLETVAWSVAKPYIPEKGKNERTDPLEKLKFDPNFTRVCVIGIFDGIATASYIASHEDDEAELMRWFWNMVALEASPLVGFNSLTFDLPFILRRSWILGVQPTKSFSLRRYETNGDHFDVRAVLANWDNYARGNLDLFSKLKFGDDAGKNGMDGSMVQAAWDAGEYEKVRRYCEQDAIATMRLYESLKGYYF